MRSTNTDNSKRIAAALFNIGSVIIRPNKPFRYDSGILSPIYVDNRLTISFPKERRLIINSMVKKIKEIGIPDAVAGTATAGIPHAAFIAQKLNIPMVYVRPKPKDHGKGNQVEGTFKRGQKVIVIEDLVSTGGSSIRVVKALRKMGAKVNTEVCIFAYGIKEADKNFKNNKVKLHALTNFKTATEIAEKQGLLKKEQIEAILDWAKDPKKWGKKMGFE